VAKQAKRERQKLNREARRQAELAAARRRRQWRTGRTIAIFAVPLVIVLILFGKNIVEFFNSAWKKLTGTSESDSPTFTPVEEGGM
jgi:hypothetical protein